MRKFLRSAISRLLAGPLAAVGAWFGFGSSVTGEFREAVVVAVTLALYGVLHKLLDAAGINPDDDTGGSG